ncbi:hypothetical protein JEQ12_017634 [Ovis aries]|uniref:Uncharacterized protein n=1 Tax=Ovis aries TaxID=9940 RepID=A0A836A4D9_SHEEP|nr:hypothetical protein JEQ12_017634 [Ovis aries]
MRSTSKREGKSLKDAGPSWSHQMLKALPGSLNLHQNLPETVAKRQLFVGGKSESLQRIQTHQVYGGKERKHTNCVRNGFCNLLEELTDCVRNGVCNLLEGEETGREEATEGQSEDRETLKCSLTDSSIHEYSSNGVPQGTSRQ